MKNLTELAGRILLGHIFLLAGINKLSGYAATQGYMEAMGVPGELLPLVILLEIAGGLAVIVGFMTRWSALALAGFTVVAAFLFHGNVGDQLQMIMFMKNLSISGGLLLVASHGAGALSLDGRLGKS